MKTLRLPLVLLFGAFGSAQAASTYLTTTTGAIYRYDGVPDMAEQTNTTTSGTLVATHAAYGTDQGTTMDLSNGKIYRIGGRTGTVSTNSVEVYTISTNSWAPAAL